MSTRRVSGRLHLTVLPQVWHDRPRTRGDCVDGPRPCPWVTCRHHLWLEHAEQRGAQRLGVQRMPDALDPLAMDDTCSLDVADAGQHTLEQVGEMFGGLSYEGVRMIEVDALKKTRRRWRIG